MSNEKVLSEDPQSPSDCDEAETDEKMLAESGSEIHSPSGSSDNQMHTADDMEEGIGSGAGSSPEDDVDVEEGAEEEEDTPMSPDAAKSDQEPDTTQLLERVDTNSESGDSNNSSEPHEENSAKGEPLEEDGDSVLTGSEAVAVREATPASPDAEDLPEAFVPFRRENDGDLPHGALDDHEGELDFEEEVNERREETDSVGEVDKAADDDLSSTKKEEGELAKDDKKEDDDDGEVEDDDDLEEGEVKESSSGRKMQPKPICRFFNKGQCTWGTSCRFLHPGINDKGNYNMFAPARTLSSGNGAGLTGHGDWQQGNGQRVSPTFLGRGTKRSSTTKPVKRAISLTSGSKRAVVRSTADVMIIPPPHEEVPQYESAWERGLRHAKEILKKSSKRKESEPDFEDKRLNLSSGGGNDTIMEYEKENDYYGKSQNPYVRNSDSYCSYGGAATFDDGYMDPYDRQAHEYWRGGNYENFEVRYTRTEQHDYRPRDKFRTPDRERERARAAPREREREPVYKERERERERSRRDNNNKLERVERQRTPERNWREPRYPEVHSSRNRGDEWRDPWRRSTTPKRRGGSRSFSSHSSASYSSSSRSRRSSSYSSYSGSSSGSSYSSYSSPPRSPSRTKATTQKRRDAQPQAPVEAKRKTRQIPVKHPVQPTKSSKPTSRQPHAAPTPQPPPPPPPPLPPPVIEKKKIVEKQPQPRVATHPGKSENSANKSLKSGNLPPRARSPTPSESDSESSGTESSHSFSSVSSASSRSSHSSKGYRKEMRMKTLDRKDEKKGRHDVGRKLPREALKRQPSDKQKMKLEQSMAAKVKSSVNQTRVEQLYDSASKDPLKQSGHKQQIKLTLLNKPVEKVQTPIVAPLKKESAKKDPIIDKKPKPQPPPLPVPTLPIEPKAVETKSIPVPSGSSSGSRKRPLSPSLPQADTTTVSKHHAVSSGTGPKQSPAVSSSTSKKSSTSSRREELLKQLKAIEDAIARKRAKPS